MTDRTVVVAVDSSAEAHDVLRAANALVGSNQIHLITVIERVGHWFGLSTIAGAVESSMATKAASWLDTLSSFHKVNGQSKVIFGSPRTVIIEYAQKADADLIVVGSHSRRWQALLGSTASAVVSQAHCDVLVVRNTNQDVTVDPGDEPEVTRQTTP